MIRTSASYYNKNKREFYSLFEDATKVYNQSLYYLRQAYFETKKEGKIKTPSFEALYHTVKETEAYKNSILDTVVKQNQIKAACNNWKSFIRGIMSYNKTPSKFKARPKIPRYKKGSLNGIEIDRTRLSKSKKLDLNEIKIPKSDLIFKINPKIEKNSIKCVRILPVNGKIKIEVIYQKINKKTYDLNKKNVIGIDIGLNNLMAVTTNGNEGFDFSYLIKGKELKSINQYSNKKIAQLKSKLNEDQYSSKQIRNILFKRKNKISNYLHNSSKALIDFCLSNNIGKIVIGNNKDWKQNINLGKRNNQNFVSIPFSILIQQIKYKAEELNIEVQIVEESYTSKVDHLVGEEMKHQNSYLGKRTKRGLFKSSLGTVLNADINGAIGILRKAKAISDVQIMNLRNRGDVVSPLKINPLKDL